MYLTKRLFPGVLVLASGLLTLSSTRPASTKQGIEGHIYRISGNQMPSPDLKPAEPAGIKTTLYVFSLTNLSQVDRQDQSSFYYAVKTKLVKKTQSDSGGYFKVQLPPG